MFGPLLGFMFPLGFDFEVFFCNYSIGTILIDYQVGYGRYRFEGECWNFYCLGIFICKFSLSIFFFSIVVIFPYL